MTQVVSGTEGHVFHNRLTHTLKVAQIARRLTERLLDGRQDLAAVLDPEVVEAAALIHDLGHPPFGHLAEKALDAILVREGYPEGYEGNAQSFRIITKLAVHKENVDGLNLTRATLNASLKYPHLRATSGPQQKKWGAYSTERDELEWVRRHSKQESKSLEAQIMEWADDVAYSVHDVEDFSRAGLIPLHRLAPAQNEDTLEFSEFLEAPWMPDNPTRQRRDYAEALKAGLSYCPMRRPYRGQRAERAHLRTWASLRIQHLVNAARIDGEGVEARLEVDENAKKEVAILKQLTWHYVITGQQLATQQAGQRRIIEDLFDSYLQALNNKRFEMLPPRFADELKRGRVYGTEATEQQRRLRTVADIIASMTDHEALIMHRRLSGNGPGSISDPLLF